jgi:ATP-dependent Clp protease ATP-binding subunit ClpC
MPSRGAERVSLQLREHFRPEFLNRSTRSSSSTPLDEAHLREIVGLLVADLQRRLAEST